MNRQPMRQITAQFLAASLSVLLFLAAIGSIVILCFGQASFSKIASPKADEFARIELNQLIGTANYQNSVSTQQTSSIGRMIANLPIPISNPSKMLESVLPPTTTQLLSRNGTQSSLMQPITTWASTTGNKIVMGWLPATTAQASINLLQDAPGINVVSPSWFQLQDASGNISVNVLPTVVNYAHAHHIRVWAMIDNQFSSTLTHAVLENPKAQANLIDELAYQAHVNQLDGINVDFENIASEDRNAFTTFVRNLHTRLSSMNINLSIDVSPDIVPLRDNAAFFHAGLAAYTDEIVLMAYDEHWSSDQDPGPVADVPWVTQSVNDLLDTGVPTDKLVLGIPFYTRYWHVHNDGQITSAALGAGDVDSYLEQVHAAAGNWNSTLDLMYARFPQPDGYMEIWYPTTQTFSDTLNLVNDDGLAGVSVWSLDWIDTKTWKSTVKILHATG